MTERLLKPIVYGIPFHVNSESDDVEVLIFRKRWSDKSKPIQYEFGGGAVDSGESMNDAIVRLYAEKFLLQATVVGQTHMVDNGSRKRGLYIVHKLCRVHGALPQPTPEHDAAELLNFERLRIRYHRLTPPALIAVYYLHNAIKRVPPTT